MNLKNSQDRRSFITKTASAAFSIMPVIGIAAGNKWVLSDHFQPDGIEGRSQNKINFPSPCLPQDWQKKGIAIEPDQLWEQGFIQNFNSPAEPNGDGTWRLWYGVNPNLPLLPNIAVAIGEPGKKMEKYQAVLSEGEPTDAFLSIGNLPEGWRPVQPVHIKLKDGSHRLYFWAHANKQRIVRLLAAESADGKRYRVIDPNRPCMYHFNDRAVEFQGTTKSGLKLNGKSDELKKRFPRPDNEPVANPDLICNDGSSIYQLSDGTFEMYVISLISLEKGDPRWAPNDNLSGYIRVIDRLVSNDGLNWNGRQTVVKPDLALDPVDQQFYYLNITHTPKGRVGMLGHFRAKDQTMDIEWCFSKDGVNWIRPFRNRSWIERGWPGEADCYGIYPGVSVVYDQGKWWSFYTGYNAIHNRKQFYGEPRSVIMFASTKSIWLKE